MGAEREGLQGTPQSMDWHGLPQGGSMVVVPAGCT